MIRDDVPTNHQLKFLNLIRKGRNEDMVASIETIAKIPRFQAMVVNGSGSDIRPVEQTRKTIVPMAPKVHDDFGANILRTISNDMDEDSEDIWGDGEEIPKKKKKKKKKKDGLTPRDLELLKIQKAKKKAQKEREEQERVERERIEAEAKAERRRAKAKKEAEIRIIQLIARKNYLNNKLDDMDPGKEKDARKIACMNIELREIDEQLSYLQSEYGIYTDTIEEGSKLKGFLNRIKKKVTTVKKKVKKFFKTNKDLIVSLSAVVLPFIGGCIFKMFAK